MSVLLPYECSGSVTGHGRTDVKGRCPWCGRKVERAAPMPELGSRYRTELGQAYRLYYDPDYGDDPEDV